MLSSSTQKNDAIKNHHHESSTVNHWWHLENVAFKRLLNFFLTHRSCNDINIKFRRNNLNLQSVKTVLNSIQHKSRGQTPWKFKINRIRESM